jgi:hypothetical protein
VDTGAETEYTFIILKPLMVSFDGFIFNDGIGTAAKTLSGHSRPKHPVGLLRPLYHPVNFGTAYLVQIAEAFMGTKNQPRKARYVSA